MLPNSFALDSFAFPLSLALTGFAASMALTPAVMYFARRVGAVDEGGFRKVYRGTMPLLGGLAVAAPFLLFCLSGSLFGFWMIAHWAEVATRLPNWFSPLMEITTWRRELGILAICGATVLGLGLWDDIRGMRARYKLLGQIAIAALAWALGERIDRIALPALGVLEFHPAIGFAVTVLWIAGLVNAFNLIDGLDGLATGIALIATTTLAVLGFLLGQPFIALLCALFAGSLAAFLFYNFNPARIFLGDTGSMFLGLVLAVLPLMGAPRTETAAIVLAPILALSLPVFETLISMVRRYARGVPIFVGDSHHTHHRLLRKGYSQRRVVLTLYAVAALLGGGGILSALIPEGSPLFWLPWTIIVGALIWVTWLAGYLRPGSFQNSVKRRRRNALYGALARYAALRLSNGDGAPGPGASEILNLLRTEMRLGFVDAWFENTRTLLAASGKRTVCTEGPNQFDPVERLRVETHNGLFMRLHYEFEYDPDDEERRDVSAALARVFEHATIDPPEARTVVLGNMGEGEDWSARAKPPARKQTS